GGTRTAAITGSFLALSFALGALYKQENLPVFPVLDYLAAVSVGIVDGNVLLDLEYIEDFRAEVDMNVIMCGKGDLVEIQGTAEARPFSRENLNTMLDLAAEGIGSLIERQKNVLGEELCRLIEKRDEEVKTE
ncbi:MAG TPA: ribonuclease PH, partial [Firmicutes bacterium]|nr:ribonuclease PH [Bacillota bacterium]